MRLSRLHQFVTRRVDPRTVGVVRAGIGIAAVGKAVQLAPALVRLDDPATLRLPYWAGVPTIADLPAWVVIIAWLVAAVAFAIGYRVTWSGAILTLVLAALLAADQQLYSNHLYLLALLVALLTLARSGAAISLDARRGRGRESIPEWPLQLIRIQISVVYLFAALAKISPVYLSGSVVASTLRRDGLIAIPDAWLVFEVMAVASLLAIATEAFLAVALWIPRWRRAAFVVGLGLHLSIAIWFAATGPLLIFGLIILSPYLLFLSAAPRGRSVVWDDGCAFCRSSVDVLSRLDWLHAIRWVPASARAEVAALGVSAEDADRALQLIDARGSRHAGFAAVVRVLEVAPLACLWAPLLRLPPLMRVGQWGYRRVAQRRHCPVAGAPVAGDEPQPSRR